MAEEPSESTAAGAPSNAAEPRPRARLAEEVQVLELPPREANGEQKAARVVQTTTIAQIISGAGSGGGDGAAAALAAAEASGDEGEYEEDEEEEDGESGDLLADYPDDTEDLEIVHSRLKSLEALRLTRFAGSLKRLCLRQNFISHLDPDIFHALVNLEELDFYDNKLKTPGAALEKLEKLQSLDLSFNLLRAVPDTLHNLKSLHTIYFVQNRISKITGLAPLASTLRSLELGGNRLRKIENLEELVNLEELWLGKNKITKLENLGTLTKLKILALQSNRIREIEGLEGLVNLEEIYFSHNGINKIQGLEKNTKLRTLDLGSNFISSIENVSHLEDLEELWLNGNQIPDLRELEPVLSGLKSLETIYLEHNPCQEAEGAGYRRKIKLSLPQIKQIDATYVRAL